MLLWGPQYSNAWWGLFTTFMFGTDHTGIQGSRGEKSLGKSTKRDRWAFIHDSLWRSAIIIIIIVIISLTLLLRITSTAQRQETVSLFIRHSLSRNEVKFCVRVHGFVSVFVFCTDFETSDISSAVSNWRDDRQCAVLNSAVTLFVCCYGRQTDNGLAITEQGGWGCMTRSTEDKNTVNIVTLSRIFVWLVGKKVPVMSPAPFWKVKKFSAGLVWGRASCSKRHAKSNSYQELLRCADLFSCSFKFSTGSA